MLLITTPRLETQSASSLMAPPLSLDTTGLFLPHTDFSITVSPTFSTFPNSWCWKALNQRNREKYAPSFGDIIHSQISHKYTIPKHCISNRILAQTSLFDSGFTPSTSYPTGHWEVQSPFHHPQTIPWIFLLKLETPISSSLLLMETSLLEWVRIQSLELLLISLFHTLHLFPLAIQ